MGANLVSRDSWTPGWCLAVGEPRQTSILGHLCERIPGSALDRSLGGSFKLDPKFLSMFYFSLFGRLMGFRGQKIERIT